MAPSRSSFATTISILFFIALNQTEVVFSSADVASTAFLRPPHGGSARHTMFLPLFLSSPTSSPSSAASAGRNSRRHLHGSDPPHPNAHMRLYDDLLLNGYYTTRLWIGTPPQKLSTVTYVPCSTCEQCGRHQDPKFEPELSSTCQPVKCNMDCTCENDRVQCIYERQYAEMSSSSGVLGEDILSFGNERMDVGGGAMVLGGISPPPSMVFTHSDPIMKELIALKRIPGPDPNYNDICFSGAGSDVSQLSKTFPVVDMVFADRQMLSLSPENYLFRGSFTQATLPSHEREFALQSQICDWSAILTIEERDPGRPQIVWPLSSNAMDCMGEREGKNNGREKGSKKTPDERQRYLTSDEANPDPGDVDSGFDWPHVTLDLHLLRVNLTLTCFLVTHRPSYRLRRH
ncbi:eukaryotic aspartyl protease family protein [Actinidia rufa]|uniref:Eukaryotic aspartyl protease family protein n=1 Tax=Actinidia rufa TaxID=165716 RepID=A0A7J0E3D1_9ERIC|nr:eukaryotic aspartyl protease family protein [Actinidia rufa]